MLSRLGLFFVREKDKTPSGVLPFHINLTSNKFTEKGLRHFVLKLVTLSTAG